MGYFAFVLLILVLPIFSYGAVDLESDLIGYWKFDEGSGNTAYNSASSKYNGKLDNGPVWADGKLSKAIYFDSNDDAVEILDSADIAEGAAITVSIWMKPVELLSHREIITKHKSDNSQWQWRLEQLQSNRLSFSVQDSKIVSAESDSANLLDDKSWHHVAGVYDGSAVHLYVDGLKANPYSSPLTGKIADYKHHICIGSAWTGASCGATSVDNFYGYIDDVRIYDRALTAEEVKELFSPTPVATLPPAPESTPAPVPAPAITPPSVSEPTPTPAPLTEPAKPQFVFTRNLTVGLTGEDVRELQKFLNNQGFKVALSGSGSPENESDYFGNLTKSALAKFQEFYKDEVLSPVGLTNGTGYFGPSTRAKIQAMLGGAVPPIQTPPSLAPANPQIEALKKQIDELQALIKSLQEQIKTAQ